MKLKDLNVPVVAFSTYLIYSFIFGFSIASFPVGIALSLLYGLQLWLSYNEKPDLSIEFNKSLDEIRKKQQEDYDALNNKILLNQDHLTALKMSNNVRTVNVEETKGRKLF